MRTTYTSPTWTRYLYILAILLLLAACGSTANTPTSSPPSNSIAEHLLTSTPTTTPQATLETTSTLSAMTSTGGAFTPTMRIAQTSASEAPPVCKPEDEGCFETTTIPTITTIPITTTTTTTITTMTMTTTPTTPVSSSIGSELLFLREGNLMAYDVQQQQERQIAPQVRSFAATPDGRLLALVRAQGDTTDIWLVQRDGRELRQMTRDARNERSLSWAPDGLTLIYDSSSAALPYPPEWQTWARWCADSEIHTLDLPSGQVSPLADGCDAAFSRDGLRIGFATPPQAQEQVAQQSVPFNVVENTIRLVNRQGKNGWAFATANGADTDTGRLVYAPVWSADSAELLYHRYIGYQALVDINYTELANSYAGNGELAAQGAGWLLPAMPSPDGEHVAILSYDPMNARGVRGYEMWRLQVATLGRAGTIYLPEGEVATVASSMANLPRAVGAAWSPDGQSLAVALPAEWQPGAAEMEPIFEQESTATLWQWQPGEQPPSKPLVTQVDYASPLAWLPPPPRTEMNPQGYAVVYPADWLPLLTKASIATYQSPDGASYLHTTLIQTRTADLTQIGVTEVFAEHVGQVELENEARTLPDSSVYHTFVGTSPDGTEIVGAMRVVQRGQETVFALLYTTPQTRWGLERAWSQAILVASGTSTP